MKANTIKVNTWIEDDLIKQEVTFPLDRVKQGVIDMKADGVRQALLKLGWRPPVDRPVRKRRDPLMKYVYQRDGYWYAQIPATNGKKKVYLGVGRNGTKAEALAIRDKYLAANNLPPARKK